jgi:phage terminase large subunit-like protein
MSPSPDPDQVLHPTKDQGNFIKEAETGNYDELWMAGGNSAGKTYTGKFMGAKWACFKIKPGKIWKSYEEFKNSPYSILCTGPEQKQAIELWEKIEESFKDSPFLKHKVAEITTGTRRRTHPTIVLKNGTTIDAIGLHDKGKHVEGEAYDLVLINEPADVRALLHCIEKVLTPRTWRRGGVIAGFGTPKGKKDYWLLWRQGQAEINGLPNQFYNPRVYSCYVDSRDNPFADQEKISRFLESKNEELIEERVEGKFTDSGFAAFSDEELEAITDENLSDHIDKSSFRQYIHGVDFGRKGDYTVCITLDITHEPFTLVNFYRKGGGVATWEEILNDLLDISKEYGGDFVIDATAAAGDMQEEWLNDIGIPFYPYQFGGSPGRKIALVNNLQDFIGKKMLRIPYIDQLLEELRSYPRDLNDKGLETDCVMSLALAAYGAKEYRVIGIPEPYSR